MSIVDTMLFNNVICSGITEEGVSIEVRYANSNGKYIILFDDGSEPITFSDKRFAMKKKSYVRGEDELCPRCGEPLNDNAVCDNCGWPSTGWKESKRMKKRSDNSKYELVYDDKYDTSRGTLYRIRALRSFGSVSEGELGGYIASEANLSDSGTCWVYDQAWVCGNAQIRDDAQIYDGAEIFGNAQIYGNAEVFNMAHIYGNAEVFDNVQVYGQSRIYDDAVVYDNAIIGKNDPFETHIFGNAQVCGNAQVYGYSKVFDNALVYGNAEVKDSKVCGNAQVAGNVDNAFDNPIDYDIVASKKGTRKRAMIDDETFATLVDEAYADFKQKLEEEWPTIESWDDAVSELYASIDDVASVVAGIDELEKEDKEDVFDTIWTIFEEEGLTKKWAKRNKKANAIPPLSDFQFTNNYMITGFEGDSYYYESDGSMFCIVGSDYFDEAPSGYWWIWAVDSGDDYEESEDFFATKEEAYDDLVGNYSF